MRKQDKPEKLGPPDMWLLGTVLVLVAIGVLLVFDASYKKTVEAPWAGYDTWFFAKRQLVFAAAGLIAMAVAASMRLKTFLKLATPLLWVSIALLAGVLVFGVCRNGAHRWYQFGPVSFQPSELAKIALVLFLAGLFARRKSAVRRLNSRWLAPLCFVGAIAFLVLKEPDLGTTIAIAGTCYVMFIAAGALKRHILGTGLVGISIAFAAIYTNHERMERVLTWLDPWRDRYGEGYQIIHSLIAHGTGGWLGIGLCEGREKAYLPAASTDFVFATVSEEAGLIGGILLIVLFLVVIYRGLDIARRAQSTYAGLLAVGATSVVGLQAAINIAVVTSSIPATGVPLPFISYGGSALVSMLISVGILLAVSRQVDAGLEDRDLYENSFDRWRDGRAHISGDQRRSSAPRSKARSRTALRG